MQDELRSISLVENWMLNSGIQNISENKLFRGGFNSWFDTEKKYYPFIYSEITGYGITTLLFLNSMYKKSVLVSRAKLAADWIIANALNESGGVKTRLYYDSGNEDKQYSFNNGMIYAFDSGMILTGLVNLYNETRDSKYLEASKRIADFLVDCMISKEGHIFPMYNPSEKTTAVTYDKWSTQFGSFHSKIFIGLLKLSEAIKSDKYADAVSKSLKNIFDFQRNDGRFITDTKTGKTHLHPHLYSAEGLLYAGIKTNDQKLIDKSANAIKWLMDNQPHDFSIPQVFLKDGFIKYERYDVVSQFVRLGSFFIQNNYIDIDYQKNIDTAAKKLLSMQNTNGQQNGGFFYGFDETGKMLQHLNSWCTMFAVQAMDFYHKLKNNKTIKIDFLI
ncbi:MAG: hypothetical protein HYW23_03680 [Candidatus Aenigmarchaeota archaeon]|nr:hypothetical protein [Candidatus Aenigmarchaeota archaeon]